MIFLSNETTVISKLNLIFEVDLNIASSTQCQFFDWQKQELRKEQENAIKQDVTNILNVYLVLEEIWIREMKSLAGKVARCTS
ncbi:hypothetical protein P5673_003323 [Acropora cervicornis]|uniref:Uncharacterized protein n=1 Tax=Acropora cervicornis TaxID=6130 RepID=A0AAD9R2F7_ACRCE|nr:hypothetical protein P5673_003323 [Acropora cervicornis]